MRCKGGLTLAKGLPVFVIAALGAAGAILFSQNIGPIEGRLAPVMGPLSLHSPVAHPPPANQFKWHGEAQKLRGCDFIRVQWFLGPRNGRRVEVNMHFTDPPEVRDTGALAWSGIVIALDPVEVRRNSHADVIHQYPYRP